MSNDTKRPEWSTLDPAPPPKRHIGRWVALGAGTAFIAVAAIGVATSGNSTGSAPAHKEKVPAAPAPQPEDPIINTGLAGTAKWNDGTTAKLSGFSWHTSTANDVPGSVSYVQFSVTIKAGANEVIDLDASTVTCPKGVGEVFTDTLPKNDTGHVLSGDSRTMTLGCAATQGKPFQVEILPFNTDALNGEAYRPAVFTGEVTA